MSDPPNQPLYGANIKPNLLDKDNMKYKEEVPELLEILEKEVEIFKVFMSDKNELKNHVRINCLYLFVYLFIYLFIYRRSTFTRY